MASRKGRPNKYRQTAIDLAQKKGVSVLEAQIEILADLMGFYRSEVDKPRPARSEKFSEVEDKVIRVTQNLMPYMLPRLGMLNIETNQPATALTVIRAPAAVADTADWRRQYGPKPEAIDAPPASAAVRRLEATFEAARCSGLDVDAQSILKEASRDEPAADDIVVRTNRSFLDPYKN